EQRQKQHEADRLQALLDGRVWLLICLYFTVAVGSNASGAYFPKLIKEQYQGWTPFQLGLLLSLPHLCAIAGMTVISAHSDRTGERRGHVCFAALLAAAGWTLAALAPSPWLVLVGFCLAQTGMMSMLPTFWTLPTLFLSGTAAAGGIALINSVANLGGLMGPTILGQGGLWSMSAILFVGALLALCVRREGGKAHV